MQIAKIRETIPARTSFTNCWHILWLTSARFFTTRSRIEQFYRTVTSCLPFGGFAVRFVSGAKGCASTLSLSTYASMYCEVQTILSEPDGRDEFGAKAVIVLGGVSSAFGADDAASTLARILLDRGTITNAEMARVEAAGSTDKTSVLASILADKGVLSASELARVRGGGAAPQTIAATPAPAATSPPMPIPKPPSAPKVGTGPAVVAENKTNVSVYSTLLLNGFSNTSLANIADIPLTAASKGPMR